MKITSTEFQQNVRCCAAQRSPVAITQNGRVHTVLMSATFFDMVTKGRIARRIEDLDCETMTAVARIRVPSEYEHLYDMIKDWSP